MYQALINAKYNFTQKNDIEILGLAIYMDAVPNKHRSPLFFFVFDTLETHLCFSLFLHPVNAYQIAIKKLHKLPLLPFIQASRQITGYCFTYKVLYKSTRTFSQLEKKSFHFCGLAKKSPTFAPNNNNQRSLRICQKICLFKQVDL